MHKKREPALYSCLLLQAATFIFQMIRQGWSGRTLPIVPTSPWLVKNSFLRYLFLDIYGHYWVRTGDPQTWLRDFDRTARANSEALSLMYESQKMWERLLRSIRLIRDVDGVPSCTNWTSSKSTNRRGLNRFYCRRKQHCLTTTCILRSNGNNYEPPTYITDSGEDSERGADNGTRGSADAKLNFHVQTRIPACSDRRSYLDRLSELPANACALQKWIS